MSHCSVSLACKGRTMPWIILRSRFLDSNISRGLPRDTIGYLHYLFFISLALHTADNSGVQLSLQSAGSWNATAQFRCVTMRRIFLMSMGSFGSYGELLRHKHYHRQSLEFFCGRLPSQQIFRAAIPGQLQPQRCISCRVCGMNTLFSPPKCLT
jgi:hypothetical protein